jgi:hypothetical protein
MIYHVVLPTVPFATRMTVIIYIVLKLWLDCNLNFEFKSAVKLVRDVEMSKEDDENDGLQKH